MKTHGPILSSLALLVAGVACSGDDGDPGAPVIERFEATPMLVTPGGDAKLTWTVARAERIAIHTSTTTIFESEEGEGVTMVRNIAEDTTFTLEAESAFGSAFATLKVAILRGPPPEIIELAVAPEQIAPAETATLTWDTLNASRVDITTSSGEEVLLDAGRNGALFVRPEETTTYALKATSRGGEATAEVTLVVDDPRPDILAFTADPETIFRGEVSTLAWEVEDADEILIRAGSTQLVETTDGTGSATVAPDATTEYALEATNGFGTTTARITVVVEAPSSPRILRFEANPNPIPSGGSTRLEWNAARADVVRIYEDGAQIAERTLSMGSLPVTPPGLETTYRLEADNAIGTSSATVTVYGHDAPAIDMASVAPATFAGSATVSVSFVVRSTSEVTLAANGAPAASRVLSSTSAVDAAGSIDVFAAGTTFFELTARSAAGEVTRRLIAANGFFESEPNDGPGAAEIHPGDGSDGVGAVEPASDEDWYRVAVPANGNIFAETTGEGGACAADTTLILYESDGSTVLVTDDDGAGDGCSRIDPNAAAAAANLPAGTYYLRVTASSAGKYALSIRATGPGCGNGILEGSEACDDGNVAPADGCSPSCTREGLLEDESGDNDAAMAAGVLRTGVDQRFYGAISPVGDEDYYAVDMPEGYHLEAYVTIGSLETCPSNPRAALTLFGQNGVTELATNDSDGPSGTCGRIGIDTTPAALGMPQGRYFLRVREVGDDAEIPIYFLHVRIIPPGCGNGLVEPGETCDDDNAAGGDGCDATCQWEIGPTISPPGGSATLPVAGTGSVAIARVSLTTDGQSIEAVAADVGLATCAGVDTALELRDGGFAPLGTTFSGGPGSCAALTAGVDRFATDLGAGTYYLFVRSEAGAGTVELDVTVVDPACGNGIREAMTGEHCDDGNTADGDGCSAGCLLEGSSGAEMEPNDTQADANATALIGLGTYTVTGANNPGGDDDVFSLVVPAGQTLTLSARTYSTQGDPTSCDINQTDTRLFLEAAGVEATSPGSGEIAFNDDIDPANNVWCSAITAVTLGSGTYYLRVQGWNDTQTTQYLMDVTLAP